MHPLFTHHQQGTPPYRSGSSHPPSLLHHPPPSSSRGAPAVTRLNPPPADLRPPTSQHLHQPPLALALLPRGRPPYAHPARSPAAVSFQFIPPPAPAVSRLNPPPPAAPLPGLRPSTRPYTNHRLRSPLPLQAVACSDRRGGVRRVVFVCPSNGRVWWAVRRAGCLPVAAFLMGD